MNKFWSFRKIVAIEETVFNNTLERFYNLGVEGLVRENIQNSLDGKLPDSEMPVYVDISTGVMNFTDIPGIEELKEHIKSLKGENEYIKGLIGAEHGELAQLGDTWGVYAYNYV